MMSRHEQTNPKSLGCDSSMMQSWQNKHLTEAQRQTLRCEYEHLRSFLANLPERALLVDVGCGDARVVVNVELGGRRYIGVDIDRGRCVKGSLAPTYSSHRTIERRCGDFSLAPRLRRSVSAARSGAFLAMNESTSKR